MSENYEELRWIWANINEVRGIEATLDLDKDNLFGFKKKLNPKIIEEMTGMLGSGILLPKVKVVMHRPGVYFLTKLMNPKTGKPDGGNHRAYAHILAEKPFPVEIVHERYVFPYCFVNIRDMEFERRLD